MQPRGEGSRGTPSIAEFRLSAAQALASAGRFPHTGADQPQPCPIIVPAPPDELFALLDKLGIEDSTRTHQPFFTVEEGRHWHDKIPGLHCKNLFIKDRKGGFWLVVMPADKRADLAWLEKT
jgi:hypothetical protein